MAAKAEHGTTRYLDGVRGLAILMVVMVHVGLHCPKLPPVLAATAFYGVRGVQLFFIVSGRTLTLAHLKRPFEPANFYARRFFRLAPMFYLGAALYLLLGATTMLDAMPRDATLGQVLATLTFVHGWSVTAVNKIVPGGWSIAAEAMFYLAFPALLHLARWRPRLFPGAVAVTYVFAGVTNLAIRRYLPGDHEAVRAFAFSFWACQLPAFATGCWLALGPAQPRLSPRAGGILALLALGFILVDTQMTGRTNLLISIALLSLLVWLLGQARPVWLETGVLPALGDISYSVYILHFAVLAVLAPIEPSLARSAGPLPGFLLLYGATLVVVAPFALLSYRWIERPAIAFAKPLFRRPRPAPLAD